MNDIMTLRFLLVATGVLTCDEACHLNAAEVDEAALATPIDVPVPTTIKIVVPTSIVPALALPRVVAFVGGAKVTMTIGARLSVEFDAAYGQVPYRVGKETSKFIMRGCEDRL